MLLLLLLLLFVVVVFFFLSLIVWVAIRFTAETCFFGCIQHFHRDHTASCLPQQILHNNYFQFLQGITVVSREIEDNGYAKFVAGKQGALWAM